MLRCLIFTSNFDAPLLDLHLHLMLRCLVFTSNFDATLLDLHLHPRVGQNVYIRVFRQSLGPVKPKSFLQQLEKLPDGSVSVPRFCRNCCGVTAKLTFFMSKWHQKNTSDKWFCIPYTILCLKTMRIEPMAFLQLTTASVADQFWPTNLCCPSPKNLTVRFTASSPN